MRKEEEEERSIWLVVEEWGERGGEFYLGEMAARPKLSLDHPLFPCFYPTPSPGQPASSYSSPAASETMEREELDELQPMGAHSMPYCMETSTGPAYIRPAQVCVRTLPVQRRADRRVQDFWSG